MPSASEPPGTSRKSQLPASDSDSDSDYSDEEGAIKIDGIHIPPAPLPYCSVENKGPRLVITQITNNFFKSYANEVVLGPFHKSFCAIVGPNGSGKSNVIDSMLFVFGYRANKIRSKKLSVLLHNSKAHPNVQSASVCVHFALIIDKGGDDYDTVPGSEFTVARTVNKDNSSYYHIDNKKVQFKEVAVLLKKHGIDLKHNRFLILQGEVEQIAMMPAIGTGNDTGMLEYLEDIIGTTRYKEPLVKLAEKVDDYAEMRTEKLNRLKIVQDEVEVLREPMREAVEFLKLENDIANEKNIIYQHNIFAIKENSKETVDEKEELEKAIGELSEKLNRIGEQKKEKEVELNDIAKKYEIMKKRQESLKEAYDQANNQHVQLSAEMQQINKDRHKFKDQLSEEQKKLENYKKLPEETASKIEDCEKAIEKLIPKSEELTKEKMHLLANMKDLTKDLQNRRDDLTKELTTLKEVVTESKTAYSIAENQLKVLTSNSDNQVRKLENLEKAYADIKYEIEQLTAETQKLQQVIPGKDMELRAAQEELPTIKQQEAQLINQIRSIRAKVEESRATMSSSQSKNRVLDALMQQKREGNCPGLIGRLGNLGGIDLKYDVAISTACGPLDNIVVDTVETGQWCIDFLKRHDIGRVTIIVLEKQQHLLDACNQRFEAPENVARLFDLIRIPDERNRPAFYYALRDTLVTDDLDQASRIAYGTPRYRVVTTKGDLIELTGAMSGGGNRVMRGRMGQSVQVEINPKEIEAIEREMQEQEVLLRQLREKQLQLENVVSYVQPEVKQMKVALEKMNMDVRGLKQREPTIVTQIKEQKSKIKRVSVDLGKVKEMENEVEVKKADYEEAAANADLIKQKIDQITAEIKRKVPVETIDNKLKELKKQMDKLKTEITRLQVHLKTSERNAGKSERVVVTLQDEIKAAESKLLEMKDKREEIETDAAGLLKIMNDLKTKIEDGTGDYTDLKNDVGELVKCENRLKSEKIDMDQKNKALKEKLDEVQQKVFAFRGKISTLKLQDIPDHPVQPLKEYNDEELDGVDMESVAEQLHRYEIKLKNLKPNLTAIDEYRKKQKIAIARSNELDEVIGKWKQVREYLDKLRTRRKEEFLTGFKIIKRKLKEMYQMITIGGDADFELVDTYDPFSEGIQFRVRPPKKTWKHISNLSGGEKTLSSLALVFALHYYKPSPLYVMDEIDAALDFKNVSIIGNYIKERTKNAQFIIISLRSMMFELASHLIGIFKIYDCTQSLSINPKCNDKKSRDTAIDTLRSPSPSESNGVSDSNDKIGNPNQTNLASNGSNCVSALPSSQDDLFETQVSNVQSEMSDIIPATQESEPMDVD